MSRQNDNQMKNIGKGPITEIFEGDWGNKITQYVRGLPIYKGNDYPNPDLSAVISHNFNSFPQSFISFTPITNNQIEKEQRELLLENYKKDCQAYNEIFKNEEFRKFISNLYELEKRITLSRCILEIDPKFTILKQKDKNGEIIKYIVARTLFYRKDLKRDEVTFYVGRMEEWGNDLEEIVKNPKFMKRAVDGLTALMVGYLEA